MTSPTATLDQDLGVLRSAWLGALPAGSAAHGPQRDLESMAASGLMDVTSALAQLRRSVDGLTARVAAEVARRSSPEAGPEGLAKKNGGGTPAKLIAIATGGSIAEANRLIAVGTATAVQYSLTGEELPAKYPYVAEGVASGALGLDAAVAITRMLDTASTNNRSLTPAQVAAAELTLVEQVPGLSLDQVVRLLKHTLAWLDPDGVEPRENDLKDDRSLRIWEDATGMVHFHARLDPESAAPVKTAIEGIVADLFRKRKDNSLADPRSVTQLQADALVGIVTHVLGCKNADLPLATVTTIVRIDQKDLTTGVGHATIDGIDQPISVGTARRMATAGNIIPMVLGTNSEVLDLGKAKRLFTYAQRLALMERDGGCASCGLSPGYLQAHHIDWWLRDDGPTDLGNGVLLCPDCHARMHRDGWIIEVKNNQVWFTPPADIDPTRTPRLGGLDRYGYTHHPAA